MHISDFSYELPPDLIAQEPADPRDSSRMMVVNAFQNTFRDARFIDLPDILEPDDLLVINDTRVIRARMHGRLERATGASRDIEVFFAEPAGENVWHVLCRPGRRIRPGDRVVFGGGAFCGVFGESQEAGLHVIELVSSAPLHDMFNRYGALPLPPYLGRTETPQDEASYQTVYAVQPGAVAAPTAGLHFTTAVMESLRARGVEVAAITLHVGIGTFLPVRTEHPEEHVLRPERFAIGAEAAERLRQAQRAGRRIIAVGTTTTRALEFVMRKHGEIRPTSGCTDLYVLPGFEFRIVRGLLTNFHLPRTTLFMLVCAMGGRETMLAAYRDAIGKRYRFYSYGDCMLIRSGL